MFSCLRYAGIGAAALVFGFSALPASAGPFSITDLGVLGTVHNPAGPISFSAATGINDAGQVVGYSTTSSALHVFVYQNGVMHDLGTTIGTDHNSAGAAINASGQVAGWTGPGSTGFQPASFTGGIHVLGSLPGGDGTGQALGINNSGVIVGAANVGGDHTHAFRYQGGTMQDLGTLGGNLSGAVYNESQAKAINAVGQIVGFSSFSPPSGGPGMITHAFLYQDGAMTDLGTLGKSVSGVSEATAINSSGQIVGYSNSTGLGPFHAFLYDHGQMHDLGSLSNDPSADTQATGINDQAQIVGLSIGNALHPDAFLYEHGHMYDLNDLVPRDSGWTLFGASAINDLGQIVGEGQNPQGEDHAFLLTPTDLSSSPSAPEPGTLALLGVGTVSLAGYGWRRRQWMVQ